MRRVVAGAVAAGAAVAMAAGPAVGKSSVQLTVGAHRASVNRAVRVQAVASNDDASGYSQVCIEQRFGARWLSLRCSAPTSNEDGLVTVRLRLSEPRATVVQLRAQLFATSPNGRSRVPEQWSPAQTVSFR